MKVIFSYVLLAINAGTITLGFMIIRNALRFRGPQLRFVLSAIFCILIALINSALIILTKS